MVVPVMFLACTPTVPWAVLRCPFLRGSAGRRRPASSSLPILGTGQRERAGWLALLAVGFVQGVGQQLAVGVVELPARVLHGDIETR